MRCRKSISPHSVPIGTTEKRESTKDPDPSWILLLALLLHRDGRAVIVPVVVRTPGRIEDSEVDRVGSGRGGRLPLPCVLASLAGGEVLRGKVLLAPPFARAIVHFQIGDAALEGRAGVLECGGDCYRGPMLGGGRRYRRCAGEGRCLGVALLHHDRRERIGGNRH